MRVLVMFDLPMNTCEERRDYIQFRKFLLQSGYMMLQESVYCRLAQNPAAADNMIANIRKNKPTHGLVQVLRITEKEYARMEYIVGTASNEIVTDDRRILIL